jgi:dihydrolipoamide dehydrogenase
LELKKVPESIIVGGVIGLELGSVWQRPGVTVTVVVYMKAIGGGMDDDLPKGFQKTLQKQDMEFKLGQKVISAKKNVDRKVDVVFEPAAGGKQETMTVDVVFGRKPYTTGLGLESVGVQLDNKGRVVTDAEFKT